MQHLVSILCGLVAAGIGYVAGIAHESGTLWQVLRRLSVESEHVMHHEDFVRPTEVYRDDLAPSYESRWTTVMYTIFPGDPSDNDNLIEVRRRLPGSYRVRRRIDGAWGTWSIFSEDDLRQYIRRQPEFRRDTV